MTSNPETSSSSFGTTSLTELLAKAEKHAARYEEDVHISGDNVGFSPFDYDVWFDDNLYTPPEAALNVVRDGVTSGPYLFSDWARSQLLGQVGVRAVWFKPVDTETECSELRRRVPSLERQKFRLLRGEPGVPGQVRGLVGVDYADIPDVHILKTFDVAVPNTHLVEEFSVQTDRARYAYALINQELRLPGSDKLIYPGITIRNSEVGFSSLVVCPFAWVPSINRRAMMTFPALNVFRRVHRGKVENLHEDFKLAAAKITDLWSDYQTKLDSLRLLTYVDEDAAVATLDRLLTRAGSRKAFIHEATKAYKALKHTKHNGQLLLEACLAAMDTVIDHNQHHSASAIAGGLLAYLT